METIRLDLDLAPGLLTAASGALDDVGTSRTALAGVDGGAVDVSAVTSALALVEDWLGVFESGFRTFWELIEALDAGGARVDAENVLTLWTPSGGTLTSLVTAIDGGRRLGGDLLDAVATGDVDEVERLLGALAAGERDLLADAALVDALGPNGLAAVDRLLATDAPAPGDRPPDGVTQAAWQAVTGDGTALVHPAAALLLTRFAAVDRRIGLPEAYRHELVTTAAPATLARIARLGTAAPASDELRVLSVHHMARVADTAGVEGRYVEDVLRGAAADPDVAALALAGDYEGEATAERLFSRPIQVDDGMSAAVGALVVAGSVRPVGPGAGTAELREGATRATVAAVARDDAWVGDGSRPALAQLYAAHIDDFAHAVVVAPDDPSAVPLAGRSGVELGGLQARRFLAEVALHPESAADVLATTAERVDEVLAAGYARPEGADHDASLVVASRYAGALQGVSVGAVGDAVSADAASADGRRAAYERIVGLARSAASDPVGTATTTGFAAVQNLAGDLLFGDGDARADARSQAAASTRALSAREVLTQAVYGYPGHLEASLDGGAPDPLADRVVAEARAFDATLPEDERFLDADGRLRDDVVAGEDPRRVGQFMRLAAGDAGDRYLALAGTTDAVGLTPESHAVDYLVLYPAGPGNV